MLSSCENFKLCFDLNLSLSHQSTKRYGSYSGYDDFNPSPGPPVNVSATVFIEFIGDIDEINMVCFDFISLGLNFLVFLREQLCESILLYLVINLYRPY